MARLRVGYQHSRFWPILVSFVDYYSLFWGPGVISRIYEPRGAFTCRSSTLAVLADSDMFRGLLLTVLWSRSDFQYCRTPGCLYVSVINTRGFGRFWSVLWTIKTVLGSRSDFHSCSTPRCACVSVISTRRFSRLCPLSWTITHCFGVAE